MTEQPLYNEFPQFLRRYFPYKVQKISLNAGLPAPIGMEPRGREVARIATIKRLIRNTAGPKKRSLYSWKKENSSLPINILR